MRKTEDVEYVFRGSHTQVLACGLEIRPGDHVVQSQLGPEDQYLVDEDVLVLVAPLNSPAAGSTTNGDS